MTNQPTPSDLFDSMSELSSDYGRLGESYICSRLTRRTSSVSIPNPMKLEGIALLLVLEGEVSFEINCEQFSFGANSFVAFPPGSMVKLLGVADGGIDFYTAYLSKEFLHNININFSAITMSTFIERQSPEMKLCDNEVQMLTRYFDLLKLNATAGVNMRIEINIATSIVAALIYQLVQFHYKRIGNLDGLSKARPCRNSYVHDFMNLVHVHYASERSVAFYAGKLCISPKYLSLLVKETTGKSAARWIDEFVLMEAKNMLRFSGKNVQQVAYALNFSNQSSFGKYFKHMTGMSPTEYQKS